MTENHGEWAFYAIKTSFRVGPNPSCGSGGYSVRTDTNPGPAQRITPGQSVDCRWLFLRVGSEHITGYYKPGWKLGFEYERGASPAPAISVTDVALAEEMRQDPDTTIGRRKTPNFGHLWCRNNCSRTKSGRSLVFCAP